MSIKINNMLITVSIHERQLICLCKVRDIARQTNTKGLSETLLEERVNVLLESISAREALMIKKRYGLDDLYIKTLEAIGEEYGLTRERVRQIVAKAIKKVLQV